MRRGARVIVSVALGLLLSMNATADEIVFSDDFSSGIGDAWTVHGSAQMFGSRLIVYGPTLFGNGVESFPISRDSDSTLYFRGDYWVTEEGGAPGDCGVVTFEWGAGWVAWKLMFVNASGDTTVQRIRFVVELVGTGQKLDEADLGEFMPDTRGYGWEIAVTRSGDYAVSIDDGDGWEVRHTGSPFPVFPSSPSLCLTQDGPGVGHWDNIVVGWRDYTPVASQSWGRVKALFR